MHYKKKYTVLNNPWLSPLVLSEAQQSQKFALYFKNHIEYIKWIKCRVLVLHRHYTY